MAATPSRNCRLSNVEGRTRGFTLFELLAVLIIVAILIALLWPATRSARPAGRRSQCKNNLKQIALALHNYHDTYGALPPAYTMDGDGRPLHSWRTLILPYLEQQRLYETIDLSKPWDDLANAEARKAEVSVYRCPEAIGPAGTTTYLAVVASDGCFRPGVPRPLAEITDGHHQTLMVIETDAEHAVPWMAPSDADEARVLAFGPGKGLPHSGGVQAAFVDGSVKFLPAELTAAQRRALISVAGGDEAHFPE